jgi:GDP-4-dehydro-6-deoxy-D-mannose reductase
MDRYLITGFTGFVSRHFLKYLEILQNLVSVLGIDMAYPDFGLEGPSHVQSDFQKMDLLDREGFEKIILQFQPDYILHLASYSSVAFSWKDPVKKFSKQYQYFLECP